MGCASSKHLKHQAYTDGWASPPTSTPKCRTPRSECSVEYYHHHYVALASSSYGYLKLDPPNSADKPSRKKNPCSVVLSLSDMYDKLMSLDTGDSASTRLLGTLKKSNLDNHHSLSVQPLSMSLTEPAISEAPPETIDVRDMMQGLEESAPRGLSPSISPMGMKSFSPGAQRKFGVTSMSLLPLEKANTWQDGAELTSPCKWPAENEDGYRNENAKPFGSENGHPHVLHPPRKTMVSRSPLTSTNVFPQASNSQARVDKKAQISYSTAKDSFFYKKETAENRVTVSKDISVMQPTMKYSPGGKVKLSLHKEQNNKYSKITPLSIPARSLSKRALVNRPESPLFDPDLVASYEKALENLSEDDWNTFYVNAKLLRTTQKDRSLPSISSICRAPPNLDRTLYDPFESFEKKCPPGGENILVLYTTTLRGIRKTFEDCNHVREILQSFGLSIDERDVSMHLEFLNELRQLMGRVVSVPRMFIKGRYIGGQEEVSRLHENGKLTELVEGLPKEMNGGNCDGCGSIRFVPCLECSGSCKLITEDNKVVRCPDCNENGLIQCPICT